MMYHLRKLERTCLFRAICGPIYFSHGFLNFLMQEIFAVTCLHSTLGGRKEGRTEGQTEGRTEGRKAENYVPPLFFEKAGDKNNKQIQRIYVPRQDFLKKFGII